MNKNNNKKSQYQELWLSEVCYLCFFGIMLFSKGIGLYDGQILYKISLLMAFGFLAVKLSLTKHSYREWIIIGLLCIWSTIVYYTSGEKGILICTAVIIGMKKVSLERVFRIGLFIWSLSFGGIFLYSLLTMDYVRMEVQHKFGQMFVPRYFMGAPHPNVLHISYFVFVVFFLWRIKEHYHWFHLVALFLGNIFIFIYSFSVTGVTTVIFLLFGAAYFKIKKITRIDYLLVKMIFPICLLISVLLPILAKGQVLQISDAIFNHRIGYSKHFLSWDNMTIFGNNLAKITDSVLAIDNSFVFTLIIYGFPMFVLIVLVYATVIKDCITQEKIIELLIISSYFIAGITEPLLFNTSFKNMTLLFIGSLLFRKTEKYKEKEISFLDLQDYKVYFPKDLIGRRKIKLKKAFNDVKRIYYYVVALISFVISGVWISLREIPERILLRRTEEIADLIIWEQIRGFATAIIVIYIVIIAFICILRYCKKEK